MNVALDRFSHAITLLNCEDETLFESFAEKYDSPNVTAMANPAWIRGELKLFAETIIETTRSQVKDELMLEEIASRMGGVKVPETPSPSAPTPIVFGLKARAGASTTSTNTTKLDVTAMQAAQTKGLHDDLIQSNRVYQLACASLEGKNTIDSHIAARSGRLSDESAISLRASMASMTDFDDEDDTGSEYITFGRGVPDGESTGDEYVDTVDEDAHAWRMKALSRPDDSAEIVHKW